MAAGLGFKLEKLVEEGFEWLEILNCFYVGCALV
jgi:hypothetical protein